MLCLLAVACAAPAPSPATAPLGGGAWQPEGSAVRLGEQALARGEVDLAEQHFRRARLHRPTTVRLHVGFGRIALQRGEWVAAQSHFEAVLEAELERPGEYSAAARVGLADVALGRGDAAAARRELLRALAEAPWSHRAHARLAKLTGLSPRAPGISGQAAVDAAGAHPYDPWALLAAGRALERAGDADAAVDALLRAVWLGDVDPASSAAAADLLVRMPGRWRGQTVVPVQLYADESVRAEDGWEFRLRTLLLSASNELAPLLDVRFHPVAIRAFHGAAVPADLESIHAAFARASAASPGPGILAAFTARESPDGFAVTKNGIAEFLGRRLTVRLAPGEAKSRVLAHEILHLYGAIHVAEEIDSLMNPNGDSLVLDALSYNTVMAMRGRVFTGEGLEREVLARVDLDRATDAYADALSANIAFRQIGLAERGKPGPGARRESAARIRRIRREDPQLADVAQVVALLMLADERTDDAVALFETAANLYGRKTPRGRQSAELAAELRRAAITGGGR